jgi:hypothetical protein
MPPLIAFSLTTQQFLDGTKTVTRRMGWLKLKAGDELTAVVKAMGLKKGEHPVVLGRIRVRGVHRERLNWITPEDCAKEGFPEMTPEDFVAMFCKAMRCTQNAWVTRIVFERIA